MLFRHHITEIRPKPDGTFDWEVVYENEPDDPEGFPVTHPIIYPERLRGNEPSVALAKWKAMMALMDSIRGEANKHARSMAAIVLKEEGA